MKKTPLSYRHLALKLVLPYVFICFKNSLCCSDTDVGLSQQGAMQEMIPVH